MTGRLVALLFAATAAAATSGCYGTTAGYYDDAYYPYDYYGGVYYSYPYRYYGSYYRPYYRNYYGRTYPYYRNYYGRAYPYRGNYYYRGTYANPRYRYTPHRHYPPNYSARRAPGGVYVTPRHHH